MSWSGRDGEAKVPRPAGLRSLCREATLLRSKSTSETSAAASEPGSRVLVGAPPHAGASGSGVRAVASGGRTSVWQAAESGAPAGSHGGCRSLEPLCLPPAIF